MWRMMWMLGGCGPTSAQIDDLVAENEDLRQRLAALEAKVDDQERERVARKERRLIERRALREAAVQEGDEAPDGAAESVLATGSLRTILADPDEAAKMGRALLHRGEDGAFDGYRLSAIRRGTILERVGLKNGDIVHSIDGHPLTGMSEAMAAYQAVAPEAVAVELVVTRRGERMNLTIPLDE